MDNLWEIPPIALLRRDELIINKRLPINRITIKLSGLLVLSIFGYLIYVISIRNDSKPHLFLENFTYVTSSIVVQIENLDFQIAKIFS